MSDIQFDRAKIKRPSIFYHLAEGFRAIWESFKARKFIKSFSPEKKGNGKHVLVLPGLMGVDRLTKKLRTFINNIGYQAHPWGLGRNLGDTTTYLPKLEAKIDKLYQDRGEKIVLIGWSLGGIYARELAKLHPEKIEQVITLCSPFKIKHEKNYGEFIMNLTAKIKKFKPNPPELLANMGNPPPMPVTALYTKTDGIVPWEVCLENETDIHKNIELKCGHIAVIYHDEAMKIIADKLAT